MLFPEALLEGMQLAVRSRSLDGGDLCSVRLHGRYGAGSYGVTVEQDGAGSAEGGLAADCVPVSPATSRR